MYRVLESAQRPNLFEYIQVTLKIAYSKSQAWRVKDLMAESYEVYKIIILICVAQWLKKLFMINLFVWKFILN